MKFAPKHLCAFAPLAVFAIFPACGPDATTSDAAVLPVDGGAAPEVRSCATHFSFHSDTQLTLVAVAGEWNKFDPTMGAMTGPDAHGNWTADITLPVGAYGYKIVTGVAPNQTWLLDPSTAYTKWVGGTENSLVEVTDCHLPEVLFSKLTKTPDGKMHIEADYVDGAGKAGLAMVTATLDGAPVTASLSGAHITIDQSGLGSTKHRVIINALDKAGHAAEPLHVPFWIEAEDFDWRDGILYFTFTDRFSDGDPTNDKLLSNIDPRANYEGGDFKGIQDKIESGYFEALGARALWVSPPEANPTHSEPGSDGRAYSGYHGYWPIDGRKIEPHFGDVAAFQSMVTAAHAHGLRILVDGVLNHVHVDHPYYLDHKNDGWFNGDGSCTCGGPNCDWDTYRLTCWFTSYLPDLNYQTFAAAVAMVDDAVYWARDLDVDGFRLDAVKHYLEIVTRRLRGKLHDTLEHAGGPSYYLVGETYTGGSDDERRFITTFLSPVELTAQFDFPIYWNILGAFASQGESLHDLDAAVQAGESIYGTEYMSPFLGNHDVPRFTTTADNGVQGDGKEQAWTNPPGAPQTSEPYSRLRLALAFLFTQDGVPLLYYGDEMGMPGAGDPDNRRVMRFTGLSPDESATLAFAQKVGRARHDSLALRRGKRFTMWVDQDGRGLYVYARSVQGETAIVAINRDGAPRTQSVPLRSEAPLSDGTTLVDRLGGPSVTASGGKINVTLAAKSAAVYLLK